jgi:peptide deformylase
MKTRSNRERKITPIVQKGNPVLRETARNVPEKDISSPKIKKIIQNMKLALAHQDDGVAIAAPQIGVSLRIFVVSKKVEMMNLGHDMYGQKLADFQDEVYINPIIKKLSKTKVRLDEGCLSVRYLYGKVERSDKATVVAYDEKGRQFTRGASGLLAQIFQHEIDHLNGILFIDKADDIIESLPENV